MNNHDDPATDDRTSTSKTTSKNKHGEQGHLASNLRHISRTSDDILDVKLVYHNIIEKLRKAATEDSVRLEVDPKRPVRKVATNKNVARPDQGLKPDWFFDFEEQEREAALTRKHAVENIVRKSELLERENHVNSGGRGGGRNNSGTTSSSPSSRSEHGQLGSKTAMDKNVRSTATGSTPVDLHGGTIGGGGSNVQSFSEGGNPDEAAGEKKQADDKNNYNIKNYNHAQIILEEDRARQEEERNKQKEIYHRKRNRMKETEAAHLSLQRLMGQPEYHYGKDGMIRYFRSKNENRFFCRVCAIFAQEVYKFVDFTTREVFVGITTFDTLLFFFILFVIIALQILDRFERPSEKDLKIAFEEDRFAKKKKRRSRMKLLFFDTTASTAGGRATSKSGFSRDSTGEQHQKVEVPTSITNRDFERFLAKKWRHGQKLKDKGRLGSRYDPEKMRMSLVEEEYRREIQAKVSPACCVDQIRAGRCLE
ncbi:unnamed protein product [Amoebophrya sp. A120]|nr:unnamed protein product [Amoebophrya sp. A120]|eukprot:GSA120T00019251001.1